MSRNKLIRYSSTMAMALVLLAGTTTMVLAGDEDRTRLECKAESADQDASMDARFESEDGRRKFSASFEAAPGGAYQPGNVLQVRVDGARVGYITLKEPVNPDVGGDLNFDDTAAPPDLDGPFPASWPGAEESTLVYIDTLGCSLQD